MPWLVRGLRYGVVTTRYPKRPDGYGPAFRGGVTVIGGSGAIDSSPGDAHGPARLEDICPTGAITSVGDRVTLDQGRCILCGRCVESRPDLFRFDPSFERAELARDWLAAPRPEEDAALEELRRALHKKVRFLRRSVHIRHIDVGSDGSEEWEIAALTNPIYDVTRLGIFFTPSPRHADLLLATGVGSAGMLEPARRTYDAMPEPKVVIAAGVDAISGGMIHPTYATRGGVAGLLPIDVWIPGSPPSPFALLYGILLGLGHLSRDGRGS